MFVSDTEQEQFNEGGLITQQGDMGDTMYIILSGCCDVLSCSGGKESTAG